MSSVGSVSTAGCAPAAGAPPPCTSEATGSANGLPPPLLTGADPTDALGMIMAAVERMSMSSMDQTESQIRADQKKLDKALEDYMDKIAEAIEAARRAAQAKKKKKKKGLFGKIGGAAAKVCAKAVGTYVDFVKDAVEAPFEVGIAVAKGIKNPGQAFTSSLKEQLGELTSNGAVAKSVEEFTEGVLQFTADFADFASSFTFACVDGALKGDPLALKALKEDAIKLWESLSDNILTNEGFWDVVEPLAKAAIVAGAVASGGVLGAAAIAVFLLLEVDAKTGFLEDVVGEDAAPWVRVGLAIGVAAASMGASGELAQAARYVQGATTAIGGLATIEHARLDMQEAKRVKQEMYRQADMQETLNRVRQLHAMVDELIEVLSEESEDRTTYQSMFNSLVQAEATAMSATLIRA